MVNQRSRSKAAAELNWKNFHLARAKLQASSKTSALLSGFLMVSMVEVHLEKNIPSGLLIAFTVCTTVVVAIHLIALFISTCILPHIDAIANSGSLEDLASSPHARLHWFIEISWIFSTGLGILLFLVQMAVMAWVRFLVLSQTAAIVTTCVIVPVLIIFIWFSVLFYRRLISYKYQEKSREIKELELELGELDGVGMLAPGTGLHVNNSLLYSSGSGLQSSAEASIRTDINLLVKHDLKLSVM